jgi:hypothetical protein
MSALLQLWTWVALLVVGLLAAPFVRAAEAVTVPGNYPAIQAAIHAVVTGQLPDGTVIDVFAGVYHEALVVSTTSRSSRYRRRRSGVYVRGRPRQESGSADGCIERPVGIFRGLTFVMALRRSRLVADSSSRSHRHRSLIVSSSGTGPASVAPEELILCQKAYGDRPGLESGVTIATSGSSECPSKGYSQTFISATECSRRLSSSHLTTS